MVQGDPIRRFLLAVCGLGPLENPDAVPIRIQNPAQKLDHVKREIVAARFFEIPAEAIDKPEHQEVC